MLITYSTLLNINRKEMDDNLDRAKLENDTAILSHGAALNNTKNGIFDADYQTKASNLTLARLSEVTNPDWVY